MRIFILFLLLLSSLLVGCENYDSAQERKIKNEHHKIIAVEFYGENEKKLDANGKIIGFGMYGDAKISQHENVKKVKIAYKRVYSNGTSEIDMETYDESHYIIINDLQGRDYEWIEFDGGGCVILYMNKNNI